MSAAQWASIVLGVLWLALVAECVRYAWVHRDSEPYDWETELPELRDHQPHHVRVIDVTGRWW